MDCYSTKNKHLRIPLKEAILQGIAPDGSLYMPVEIPRLSADFINTIKDKSFNEIALSVISLYFGDHIPLQVLEDIVNDAYNFPIPVKKFDRNLYVCELFHGPTFAFKDFGARFLSRILSYYQLEEDKDILILVATSGDTGGAVASGFYGAKGIKVGILYPSDGVSPLQEKQLTTWGGNISAFEIEGTFDDCQKLVKTALIDDDLRLKFKFSSANSINLARLIPQSLYYFEAYKSFPAKEQNAFIVPSGNLGNLFAGILAKHMGLDIHKLIAACNANDSFPVFIKTGKFEARRSVRTLSNAMDVGNPSNFERIDDFYGSTWNLVEHVKSYSVSDEQTLLAIHEFLTKYDYLLDPHGAVGYSAYLKESSENTNYCIMETAHPAKFDYIYLEHFKRQVEIPLPLYEFLEKKKVSIKLSTEYNQLKDALLSI